MFEQLIWYLKGYVRIRITGYSPERFLNACRYKNIYIWDLKRVCGSYEMNLTIDGFRRLKRDRKEDRYEGLHHTPQWSSFSFTQIP